MGSVGIRFGRNVPLQHTDPYQKMKESDKGKGDNRPSEDYSANDGLMEPNPFVVSQKLLSRPYKKDKKRKSGTDKNGKPVDEFVTRWHCQLSRRWLDSVYGPRLVCPR